MVNANILNLDQLPLALNNQSSVEFFQYTRSHYLHTHTFLPLPAENPIFESTLNQLSVEWNVPKSELWGTSFFQLNFRASKPQHLSLIGISSEIISDAVKAVENGRVMSILPYNMLMPFTTISKFIPKRPETYARISHSLDPYGIFRQNDRIMAKTKEGKKIYLATRKFPYAVLVNIVESCPIGCDGCYKGSMIRTTYSALASIYPEYAAIKQQLTLEENRVVQQMEYLVKWLNLHEEVDTVVISGGEPLLFSNNAWRNILRQLSKANHIKVVRVCTSAVFQGLWYRIDDEFIKILKEFESKTGKQFYVNAHVTDEFQLSTAEAKIAIQKLQNAGISIHLQLPLQEGINFKRNDLSWSIKKLQKISKTAYQLGVIPYKLIVDMHSPSDAEITVPIETVTKVIAALDQHTYNSDHERWQAYNILHEEGNLYLNAYPHFSAVKVIDELRKRVTYFIPKILFSPEKIITIHTYEEPLIPGHNNDPNSLPTINDLNILQKIGQVKQAYSQFINGKTQESNLEMNVSMQKYYEISNIKYPKNEPIEI